MILTNKLCSEAYIRFFLCSTSSTACFAEHFENQLSPSRTVTSLVWTSFPGMKARGPKGTCQRHRKPVLKIADENSHSSPRSKKKKKKVKYRVK